MTARLPAAALDTALEEPCDPEVEDCAPPATPVVNQVPVRGLSGTGGDTLYAIDVPAGVSGPLSITTSGGTTPSRCEKNVLTSASRFLGIVTASSLPVRRLGV